MIHVCFALYDKAGHYARFTGTAMLSLFENAHNTPPQLPSITVHLLHDNTLTDDNRDKLIQITEHYGQQLKFYNVEELCADRFAQIGEYFPDVYADRHSIATFYRFFILDLLPKEIEKVLYLDSDIIVNLDIAEFWQIDLGDKPFGAVPEVNQFNDKNTGINLKKRSIKICGGGVVNPEDYFNAGVMLMNTKVLREEEATILAGMKFISEHPQFDLLDQDILNYCFSTSYLKLPTKFNRFVLYARRENKWTIEKNLYHYAASRICFVMDSRDPYNQLFMKYFIKTPWVDADTKVAFSGGLPSRKKYPVSVVIPLYNMAEYVGECLDSLLAQTFQAFEVIVVDDCSTDNSVEVVEEYAPKFNGRLRLTQTKKNSGGGGYVPRNIGLKLARGKYVYFLDSDDMILATALETFYSAAILYDADIVYTKTCYFLNAPDDISIYKDFITRKSPNINLEFTIDDANNNLSRLLSSDARGEFNTIQTTFLRREFLLVNGLFFPQIARSGDFLWLIRVYCHARRFLRISTPLCFRRHYNLNSITRTVREPKEQYSFWFAGFVEFAKALQDLKRENEFLAENPFYNLLILKKNLLWSLDRTEEARKELGSEELFKILHDEFVKNFPDSLESSLLPFLFSFIDNEEKINAYYLKPINKFKPFITARIDAKLLSTAGDFQILSLSDDQATLEKPRWLQKGGVGYHLESYAGKLNFTVKATVDGQVQLWLRGIDIRDPKDRSKRIPYWIDYTKLTMNGETILDTLTPAWHDKSYIHKINAKAGEEIPIQIEWQPHRADTIEVKAETPPPVKVESAISDSFKPFITARIDAKFVAKSDVVDFRILSLSDDKAIVFKPNWYQKNETGYVIQSITGNLEIVSRAGVDGQVQLRLRGVWVSDPKDKSKLIPYWIDYTKLTIGGKIIFDEITPVWHDKPYFCKVDVKAGEEIKIHIEWLPHRSDT